MSFLTRHKAGLILGAVFLVAWVLALIVSSDDRRGAQDPDRWIKGPPAIVDDVEPAPAGD